VHLSVTLQVAYACSVIERSITGRSGGESKEPYRVPTAPMSDTPLHPGCSVPSNVKCDPCQAGMSSLLKRGTYCKDVRCLLVCTVEALWSHARADQTRHQLPPATNAGYPDHHVFTDDHRKQAQRFCGRLEQAVDRGSVGGAAGRHARGAQQRDQHRRGGAQQQHGAHAGVAERAQQQQPQRRLEPRPSQGELCVSTFKLEPQLPCVWQTRVLLP